MKPTNVFFKKATIMVMVLFANASILYAQQPVARLEYATDKIRFVGMENNLLVFDIHLTALPLKGSTLRILDQDGLTLFEERIHNQVYNKRYKILKENLNHIYFQIRNKQILLQESFGIRYKVEERCEVVAAR